MRILAVFLLALTAGCGSQVGAPEKKRDEQIARIMLTSQDTNHRLRIHEDFANAADTYLSDVDNILVRTEKRLKDIEDHLILIAIKLDILKSYASARQAIDKHITILKGGIRISGGKK